MFGTLLGSTDSFGVDTSLFERSRDTIGKTVSGLAYRLFQIANRGFLGVQYVD